MLLRGVCIVGWFLALSAALLTQGPPNPGSNQDFQRQPPPPGPRTDRPGPWDNDVHVFQFDARGTSQKIGQFDRAGVPTLVRLKDGRLLAAFQHFPENDPQHFDRVAVRFSKDEGQSWSAAQPIVVANLEQGLMRPFDPTLVVLPDGRVRMYFTSNRSRDFRTSTPAIYSAISEDGVHYAFEPGVRFAVKDHLIIDCAVALHDGVYHMIVPHNGGGGTGQAAPPQQRRPDQPPQRNRPILGRGYHAVSQDGLQFDRVDDVMLPNVNDRWLGNLVSDNKLLYFFGTGAGPWPVYSRDGKAWQRDAAQVRFPGADPGAVRLKSGGWLIIATSPPRPGTPSDRQRPSPPDRLDRLDRADRPMDRPFRDDQREK